MHKYTWDPETGGILLLPTQEKTSKEPRPVYYREMNLLGMDKHWKYPQNDEAPIMWAEAERYIYRGVYVAHVVGGGFFEQPKVIYTDTEEAPNEGAILQQVNIDLMLIKNSEIMDQLVHDTVKQIYDTYIKNKQRIDIFYVAFSGGKDSLVALDMVQRTLPHNAFKVVFGDTQMEFPDTYKTIETVESWCQSNGIDFIRAKSHLKPKNAWENFGPPATRIRWCCSVFKTTPQILLLREIIKKPNFTGMALTGIRSEESVTRGEYDDISEGKKHKGQYSYHVIFDWNSAEVFLHIYKRSLPLCESYYKGIPRAGCLVCPNSVGRSDYFRRIAYKTEIDDYLNIIRNTSNKSEIFNNKQMTDFINYGYWRTRSTGRELNFGHDLYKYRKTDNGINSITIYKKDVYARWLKWLKTIGEITNITCNKIEIKFQDANYTLTKSVNSDGYDEIFIMNCVGNRTDIKFLSLIKSTIIKAIYCANCGVCVTECMYNCIEINVSGINITGNCTHCYECHNIYEHCLRYYSLRNRIQEEEQLGTFDRYFSFGFRNTWLESFISHNGDKSFWETSADGLAPNKRQVACHQFMCDAGIVKGKWKTSKDPETLQKVYDYKSIHNTKFGDFVLQFGSNATTWSLIFINLITNPSVPTFKWYIKNCELSHKYDEDELYTLLIPVFDHDDKGHGKQNVLDSLKILFATTPLGNEEIIARIDVTAKSTGRGDTLSLNSITRVPWYSPVPEVILYSLYKFAEACGNYYQFTLTYLMDESIEREGISPTTIFGLNRNTMIRIINGLAINYPDFISATFTYDLDTITLRKDKKSEDVLELLLS